MKREPSILGAALIAGLGSYCPIPVLRGALVGLMPGIALRSWKVGVRGALWGCLADFGVSAIWMAFGPSWDPRGKYSVALSAFLPPLRMVVNPGRGDTMAFFPGLLLWWAAIYIAWAILWSPRPSFGRVVKIVAVGQAAVLCAATFLWMVVPWDEWTGTTYELRGIESPLVFLIVFLTTMPWCSLVVAGLLKRTPEPMRDPLMCRECRYNLTGNVSGVCPECGTRIAEWRPGDPRFAVSKGVNEDTALPPRP
jgi:hypothetical protein